MDNENLEVSAVETPTVEPELSPAEMFFNDLNAEEVSTDMEENPQAEAIEEVLANEQANAEQNAEPTEEPMPEYATRNDVEDMKSSVLAEIMKMAARRDAEQAMQNAPKEVVPETPQPTKEEMLEKYYENPLETIEQRANEIADAKVQGIMEQLAPLLEQSKATQNRDSIAGRITDFLANTPDGRDYMDEMVEYIKANGLDPHNDDSYRNSYRDIKLHRQAGLIDQLNQNRGKTLDDYLADENSLNQILGNDSIKARIIENYLKDIQNGAKPQTISSGGSVQAVGTPANAPRSIGEAGELLKASFGR